MSERIDPQRQKEETEGVLSDVNTSGNAATALLALWMDAQGRRDGMHPLHLLHLAIVSKVIAALLNGDLSKLEAHFRDRGFAVAEEPGEEGYTAPPKAD